MNSELVLKKRTIIRRVPWAILGIALFIGVCIFPYPALFSGNSLPKQPELSPSEKQYFDKFKNDNPWNEIGRMYVNVDSLGQDIMVKNRPIDFSNKYRYTLSLETEDTACYFANYTPESGAYFAKYIKDSICLNSPHLIESCQIITSICQILCELFIPQLIKSNQ